MITAVCASDGKLLVTISGTADSYVLERKEYGSDEYLLWTADGFVAQAADTTETDTDDEDTATDETADTDTSESEDTDSTDTSSDEDTTETTDETSDDEESASVDEESSVTDETTDTDDVTDTETSDDAESTDTTDAADDEDTSEDDSTDETADETSDTTVTPLYVAAGDVLDNSGLTSGQLYSYRCIDSTVYEAGDFSDSDWEYSNWVRNGTGDAVGYTFGNYIVPDGCWGTIVTEDDIRYTYLWGTDFKATNGASYSDEQIRYFIDAATEEMERLLNITIIKRKVRFNAEERGLTKGTDYDVDETAYDFMYQDIARYASIKTRRKPVIRLHSLKLLSRMRHTKELKSVTVLDKEKGVLKMMERPLRPSDRYAGIAEAVGIYGQETFSPHVFYGIDYDAGYETSDDVPADLRQIIAKKTAVDLLNIIGDGLMSGFSSSSLSMDGLSESFSSTQSATSAYFGARIKEYKDDIDNYVRATKAKFGAFIVSSI